MTRWIRTLGACAAGLISCGDPSLPADSPGEPPRDLIVIVLDALPASSVSAYGYGRETTPHLDALAAGGQRFEAAFTSASYTLASTASLMTGMTPRGHGVEAEVGQVLGGDHQTLAEKLQARGFHTAAFSLNPQVSAETGFDQGFDVFAYEPRDNFTYNQLPAGFLERVAATWTSQQDARRFLYVHLLPPHVPYTAPPPFDTAFDAHLVPSDEGGQSYLRELNLSEPWLTPADPRIVRAKQRYDAGLMYADAMLAELLAKLDQDGSLDHAAIVITSDHGEAFGEHGRILHGSMASEEMLRVPLIFSGPGVQAGVRDDLVRTRDLAATMCEWLDVGWDGRMAYGRSFLRAPGLADEAARGALARSSGSAPIWSLRTQAWTYVLHTASGREELYDRAADPLEQVNLAATNEPERALMAQALTRALAREREINSRYAAAASTDAHTDALQDIGYFSTDELPPSDED
jgi:arylsulfatase A-like enzyme